jgi:hypothetical protein
VFPLQTSSIESAHGQNVAQRPPGRDSVWVAVVAPAESIAPTR